MNTICLGSSLGFLKSVSHSLLDGLLTELRRVLIASLFSLTEPFLLSIL